ncbi:MAG: ABC transporter substrate binding protein [Gammaproteobacteria bacterium]|nr:ABC transporter substrate binding protein [Gammaproteobacteria bacterium]
MHGLQSTSRRFIGLCAAAVVTFATGCTVLQTEPDVVETPPPAVVVDEPVVDVKPAPPAPPPPPEPVPEPVVTLPFAAILLSDDRQAYREVATELQSLLEDYATYNLSTDAASPGDLFAAIHGSDAQVVIAIGLPAARQARQWSSIPVVFCQVFNVTANDLLSDTQKGVSATPPLDLQLAAWKHVDPDLANVGVIVGEGHEELMREADRATRLHEITLHTRVARSDRETMYLFDRLVPDIDGFWLFPDNRILSRAVLRHMFDYAAQHEVQMAVFNESLLKLGAVISATAVSADIATTTVDILERLAKGDITAIPPMTPLSDISIRINDAQTAGSGSTPDAVDGANALVRSP